MTPLAPIGVIGSGECASDDKLYEMARDVGRRVALSGRALVNGGLGGVMEGSARGAKEGGGLVIGILPGPEAKSANPYVDVSIPSGMGEARNALIVRSVAGLIAIGGGYGTLSELAFALKAGLPVVGLGTWQVSEEIIEAEHPEEAVVKLLEVIEGVGR